MLPPPRALRMLHVEDSESDAGLVQRALVRSGFAIDAVRVETADEMRQSLRDGAWDIVIADFQLPTFNAMGALQVLHESGRDLPFVVVSGTIGEDIAVAVMRAGAHDYVMKDRLERLGPAVSRELAEAAVRREHAASQRALRQVESQYRAAIETSADGFLLLDAAHRLQRVNAAFERQSGYARDELVGMPVAELSAGADATELVRRIDDAWRGGRARFETRLRNRQGGTWEVELSVSRSSGTGDPLCLFVRDITEQKKTALEIRRFVEASPAVIYALRPLEHGFDLVWVSDNLEALTGFHPREVDATWWERGLHPDDVTRVVAANALPLPEDHGVIEFRFRHRDGRYVWLRDQKRVVRDAGGKVSELVGSWTDITSRVELEDQFRHAQKMEAVGRLAGGVAHDFNNVLTVIQGYGGALLDDLLTPEEVHDSANQICLAADRAAALTRQLLAFSRKQTLVTQLVDVGQLVKGVERLLHRLIGEDVALTTEITPGTPRVKGDPGHLEQVLINLAVNARDAMPEGGSLSIVTSRADVAPAPGRAGGAVARIVVTDTGRGMTDEVRARVFEPFFTTKEAGRGTGLGLSIVFGVVHQMGGTIDLWSAPGEGARFTIDLPVAPDDMVAAAGQESRVPDAVGTETVLVVEDEEPVRHIARVALESRGYHVVAAASGAEGLALADTTEIDLLLTDVVMPGMSGRAVATALLAKYPSVKVLYMSGYFDDAHVRAQLAEAQASVLQKPFTPRALAAKVRQVLDFTKG
ncbi:MAG: response regulator [Vicinamibacterales bacterium]